LANAVKHGAVLYGGRDVDVEHLPQEVFEPPRPAISQKTVLRKLADVEREHVMAVLEACGGQPIEAARILGYAASMACLFLFDSVSIQDALFSKTIWTAQLLPKSGEARSVTGAS